MHLLIPFAFCSSDGCAAAVRSLQLPHLEKLLARLTPGPLDSGDEYSLSTPHERALARTLGLAGDDGMIAWAALQAAQTGHAGGAWAFVTPCHWHSSAKHVAMSALALPDFTAQESQTLLAAMQPYFEEDGITLHYAQPQRWLARSDLFNGLASASLDRVAGRNIKNWLPRGHSAIRLQRLQAEMQMLLYTHPVNDQRVARGVPVVNSFWLSGTGALEPSPGQPAIATPGALPSTLREGALTEDWTAWSQAWSRLDATECAALLRSLNQGERVQLTLCGERKTQSWSAQGPGHYHRLMSLFGSQSPSGVLEKL